MPFLLASAFDKEGLCLKFALQILDQIKNVRLSREVRVQDVACIVVCLFVDLPLSLSTVCLSVYCLFVYCLFVCLLFVYCLFVCLSVVSGQGS